MNDWIPIRTDDSGRYLGEMPKDDQVVLVSYGKVVTTDRFIQDGDDGCGWFEFFDEPDAWMPMPEPY